MVLVSKRYYPIVQDGTCRQTHTATMRSHAIKYTPKKASYQLSSFIMIHSSTCRVLRSPVEGLRAHAKAHDPPSSEPNITQTESLSRNYLSSSCTARQELRRITIIVPHRKSYPASQEPHNTTRIRIESRSITKSYPHCHTRTTRHHAKSYCTAPQELHRTTRATPPHNTYAAMQAHPTCHQGSPCRYYIVDGVLLNADHQVTADVTFENLKTATKRKQLRRPQKSYAKSTTITVVLAACLSYY